MEGMMKRDTVTLLLLALIFIFSGSITASPGDLDSSFGHTAPVISTESLYSPTSTGTLGVADSMVLQSDGKIFLSGYYYLNSTNTNVVLARLNSNGTTDSSFGTRGIVQTFSTTDSFISVKSFQYVDQSYITVGFCGDHRVFLMKYKADGLPDTSFAENGCLIYKVPDISFMSLTDAELDRVDNSIYLSGIVNTGTSNNPDLQGFILKFTSEGILDENFGNNGTVFYGSADGPVFFNALIFDTNRKILVAGQGMSPYDDSAFLTVRFNPDGTVDSTFGNDGRSIVNTSSKSDTAFCIALQSDGKIIVAGNSSNSSDNDFTIIRLSSDGVFDPLFGNAGIVKTDIAGSDDYVRSLSVSENDNILLSGYSMDNNNRYPVLSVYSQDGDINTSFADNGILYCNYMQGEFFDTLLEANGRITACGYTVENDLKQITVARFNSDGTSDNLFLQNSKKVTVSTKKDAVAKAVIVNHLTTDGIIYAAGDETSVSDKGNAIIMKFKRNGVQDLTFGEDGFLRLLQDDGDVYVKCIAVNPLGGPVIAGYIKTLTETKLYIASYDSDGKSVTHFGGNGIVTAQLGFDFTKINAITLQSDGKIIVGGTVRSGGSRLFLIARYTDTGDLDTTFAGDGTVTVNINSVDDEVTAIALDETNGDIYAGGFSTKSGKKIFALACLTSDGSLKSSFGTSGIVTTDKTPFDSVITSLVVDDSKITAAGYTGENDFQVVLSRYLKSGSPDISFGPGTGFLTTSIDADAESVNIQLFGAGKLYLSSFKVSDNKKTFFLTALNGDGTIDNTFGYSGSISLGFSNSDAVPYAMCLQPPDNSIILAGYSDCSNNNNFALARFSSEGIPDSSFGYTGMITVPLSVQKNYSSVIRVQPDGKIISAGYSDSQFTLFRYDRDGFLDSNFGDAGKVILKFSDKINKLQDIFIQEDGKILVCGKVTSDTNSESILFRLLSDGTPDASFASNGLLTESVPDSGFVSVFSTDSNEIFTVSNYSVNSDYAIIIVKYDENGNKVTNFGSNGIVLLNQGDFVCNSAFILSDNSLLIAGTELKDSIYSPVIIKISENGEVADTFGNNGILKIDNFSNSAIFTDITVGKDNNIYAAGVNNSKIFVCRFDADGNQIEDFGGSSGFYISPDSFGIPVNLVKIDTQNDGKTVLFAVFNSDGKLINSVIRLKQDGLPDGDFGPDGIHKYSDSFYLSCIFKNFAVDNVNVYTVADSNQKSIMTLSALLSEKPVISVSPVSLEYPADFSDLLIASAGEISDPDGENEWNGAVLEVFISQNPEDKDTISIINNSDNMIRTEGADIFYNDLLVALSDSVETSVNGSAPLTITFNKNADASAVQAVLRSIAFSNSADVPHSLDRVIHITLFDSMGLSDFSDVDLKLILVPRIETLPIRDIEDTVITAEANLLYEGGSAITECGFCWGVGHNPVITSSEHISSDIPDSTPGVLSAEITGLSPGTQYFLRSYASNSEGITYGNEISFITHKAPDIITIQSADLSETDVKLNGQIVSDGIPSVSEYGFCWSEGSSPELNDPDSYSIEVTNADSVSGEFFYKLSDLTPGREYFYRSYAVNDTGTYYGDIISFITYRKPAVETLQAEMKDETTLTLKGRITDFGVPSETEYGFCWAAHESDIPDISGEHTAVSNADSSGLFIYDFTIGAEATCYYRAYITNSSGTYYGDIFRYTNGIKNAELLLSVFPEDAGTTDPAVAVLIPVNSSQTIKAIPAESFHFEQWRIISGTTDISDPSSAETSAVVSEDTQIEALFAENSLNIISDSNSMMENGGNISVTLSLNYLNSEPVDISLSSTENERISYPAKVSIPAGAGSVVFVVNAVDNTDPDGNTRVTLNADATGCRGVATDFYIIDDDSSSTPELVVTPQATNISEDGTPLSIDVVLSTKPASQVNVSLKYDSEVLSLNRDSLTFSGANWAVSQKIIVTPVDNALAEGDFDSNITFSSSSADSDFDNLKAELTVKIIDDDPSVQDITVNIQPGETLSIDIEDAAYDPQNDSVYIEDILSCSGGNAEISDSRNSIIYHAPSTPGTFLISYSVTDGNGGNSNAVIYLNVAELVTVGSVFYIKTENISELKVSGFQKKPKIYAKYHTPFKNKDLTASAKVINISDDKKICTCLWKKRIRLFNFSDFKKLLKSGGAALDILTSSPLKNVNLNVFAKTVSANGKIDVPVKVITFTPPQILTISVNNKLYSKKDGDIPEIHIGDNIILSGNFFGIKPPIVYVMLKDADNKNRMFKMKLKKPYIYSDFKKRQTKSCMNINTGESTVEFNFNLKYDNLTTPGEIILYNKSGIDAIQFNFRK
jgi:uncharacterized delta-60 repeat protein